MQVLDELMKRVSEAYDADGAILRYYKQESKDESAIGDGLATFIVNEILSVYPPDEGRVAQLAEVKRAMNMARQQLDDVINAIEEQEKVYAREIRIKALSPEDLELLEQQKKRFGDQET